MRKISQTILGIILFLSLLTACTPAATPTPEPTGETPSTNETSVEPSAPLVLYSGRSESLVAPVIQLFSETSGVEVEVRYGNTAEIAATLLEEGENTPADVFWAQDPGGLGAIAVAGMFAPLPQELVEKVPAAFRSPENLWVGISGRARVVVYNTDALTPDALPADIWDFTDPKWAGKIGWAPTNGSFQVMVTGMRQVWGEEKTRQWLEGILANNPVAYENNTAVVAAVGAGEVEIGFVNHYYLYRFLQEEGEAFAARNYFLPGQGPGSLVMVAGAGILKTSDNQENAEKFLQFLLSTVAQQYFATQTWEYPLIEGVVTPSGLTPLADLHGIEIDLANLADLQGTVSLLTEVGALP
ncbi:MAG: iron ABC transporter substrate-binding protein [Anaerolineales bacterium]